MAELGLAPGPAARADPRRRCSSGSSPTRRSTTAPTLLLLAQAMLARATDDRAAAPGRAGAVARAARPGRDALPPGRRAPIRATRSRSSAWPGSRSSAATSRARLRSQARRALAIDPENAAAQRLVERLEEVLADRGEPRARGRRRAAGRRGPAERRRRAGARDADAGARAAPEPRRAAGRRSRSALARRSPAAPSLAIRLPEPTAYRSRMTRILVTGGAGYVGSVSVDALLAAGHEVVVLDDLTTGHRAAVPAGARLPVGHLRRRRRARAASSRRERIEAILHCAARSLVGESIRDPATLLPRQRRRRHRAARGRARGRRRAARLLARRPRSTASPTRRRSPRTRRSARSTRTARRSGRSRARSPGTAGPTACAACRLRYFNVAGATERARRGPRPRDAPDPERPRGRRRRRGR